MKNIKDLKIYISVDIEGTAGMLIPASYHIFTNSISYSGVLLDNVAVELSK